ncbi:MAG: sugar transferase [Eubacterium sp.]|nr:sugar transferase [Eubacterium sp.]
MIKPWRELPPELRIPEVAPYYKRIYRKRGSLLIKRGFDITASFFLLIISSPVMLALAVWIKLDSRGPVFFRQERVTQYGRHFRICKFRTMVMDAEKKGKKLTANEDPRITRVGRRIRSFRLDELPQLFNILAGDMTFVGTRPEVPEYVAGYLPEWKATLLLPAGVTSKASVAFRKEDDRMKSLTDQGLSVDEAYMKHILPEKMQYNLKEIKDFTLLQDFVILWKTVFAVLHS